jgi:chemotaxis methyl-accepting protein methylase
MNDEQFRQLLNHLGLSWDGYRRVRKGVKKRIGRHMQHLGCRTLEQYISVLDRSQDTRRDCEDRGLWGVLEKEILPSIIKEHTANVKIWSAGCACGEEVYSLKMLWNVIEQKRGEKADWPTHAAPGL